MTTNTVKPGDVVKLKGSERPFMTVNRMMSGRSVEVVWFADDGQFYRETLSADALKPH